MQILHTIHGARVEMSAELRSRMQTALHRLRAIGANDAIDGIVMREWDIDRFTLGWLASCEYAHFTRGSVSCLLNGADSRLSIDFRVANTTMPNVFDLEPPFLDDDEEGAWFMRVTGHSIKQYGPFVDLRCQLDEDPTGNAYGATLLIIRDEPDDTWLNC